MKAFEVRKNGKLIDVIVELSLDQAIKVAAKKYPNEKVDVFESPCTIGKDIAYSNELNMYMIKLGNTYYPLIEWVCTKPLEHNSDEEKKTNLRYANCNTIGQNFDF